MSTYSAKPTDVTRVWHLLDASELSLGRLSAKAAELLIGKGKPQFTKHIDTGDFVVVINSGKLVATGKKLTDKKYYRHSGFPGGITERSLGEQIDRDSTKVIFDAVRGMLPVNKLRDGRLQRLKIYTDEIHNHDAQKPVKFSFKETK